MNIAEFLEARIEEDERRAGSGWSSLGVERWATDNYGRNALTPSAVLAECAAKRAVMDAQRTQEDDDDPSAWIVASNVLLKSLATVYKDHPDYQQEWSL
jgi:hypothetical protein